MGNLCQWKPPSPSQQNSLSLCLPHPIPSGLRQESLRLEDSPTSGSSGANRSSSSFREDSITSSLFGDSESVATDDIPVLISRKATGDWDEGGLGISGPEDMLLGPNDPLKLPTHPNLVTQQSAPGQMEHGPSWAKGPAPQRSLEKLRAKRESIEKRRNEGSVDSADDEDDELGQTHDEGHSGSPSSQHYRSKSALPSSKLGIEMMRANSHDSVSAGGSEGTITAEPTTQVVTPNQEANLAFPQLSASDPATPPPYPREDEVDTTVIISTPPVPGDGGTMKFDPDETPRPIAVLEREIPEDEEPTPRPPIKSAGRDIVSPFPGAI